MHVDKPIDLALLADELAAAGVAVGPLSKTGTDDDGELWQAVAEQPGWPMQMVDLPPEAQPVVDAHTAPAPVYRFAAGIPVEVLRQTTDDAPTEVWRLASEPRHEYAATLVFMATDEATFAVKRTDMVYVWKRAAAAPILVGEAPISNTDEQGSASWDVMATVDGDDLVVRVVGGRTSTVDWLVRGRVELFAPGGLE